MSRALLICPDRRPGLEGVTGGAPLALAVFLGKPLVEHALDALARGGVTAVRLLAGDRPNEIRDALGGGAPWGLRAEVVAVAAEPSPADAAAEHAAFGAERVLTLDELPQAPGVRLLDSPAAWHAARATLLPLLAPAQVGARELSPGVWAGLRARVEDSARLTAPCWIGPHAIVRAHAKVGPRGYVETGSLVEEHAEVEDSTVGPRTYLGGLTHLRESCATGATLTNWRNGSETRLTDAFLLAPLAPARGPASSPAARLLALLVLAATLPVPAVAALLAPLRGTPWRRRLEAALPAAPGAAAGAAPRTVIHTELAALRGPLRRWPRLWRIVAGDFAWTGNPPLTPEEAAALQGEFERLWLETAPGLFTAPEAEGCAPPWDDAARAHAALFACQPTPAWRRRILRRGLAALFHRSPP